ncbi:hypothetical protein [Pontibacillus marinus]|uniref:Membrane protein n=1 Tax=Pontibacillus marinus BH030004 = DSM 16465 TaxID=1385511 RepID=A0A0A5G023_9BACI|nr:hypothetical protein [Pontibacillus marinus]KGX84433.1 membrane protein [Pontibacillus marinus BH030004 = DSM 16465]
MKIAYKAVIYSLIIHIAYFASMWFYGFVKTKLYQPSISHEWSEMKHFQEDVVYGVVLSPWYYVASFFGLSLLCGLLLFVFRKSSD